MTDSLSIIKYGKIIKPCDDMLRWPFGKGLEAALDGDEERMKGIRV
jgi:hypothetical protein